MSLFRPFAVCVAVTAAAAALSLAVADAPTPGRFALLVGVNDYDHSSLKHLNYAVNDVTALRDVLVQGGYVVVLLTEDEAKARRDDGLRPTKANIEDRLKTLAEKFPKGGTLLIGLSGHGVQFGGDDDGYFCPVDARPFKDRTNTLVSVKGIYDRLKEDAAAGAKLVLVDACRDDPDPNKGARRGIDADTTPAPPRGVGVLLSCSAGEFSYETDKAEGGHGIFFYRVLEGMKGEAVDEDGEVTWDSLRTYVKKRVPRDVKLVRNDLTQSPEESGRLSGAPPVLLTARKGTIQKDPPPSTAVVQQGPKPSPLDCTGEKGVSAAEVRKSQETWAMYLGRKVEEEDEIAPGVKMKFSLVPPGKFLMGSPRDEKGRVVNNVQHEVELTRPIYLGVNDVTQAQYEAVTGKNPSNFKGADLPVEAVSWEDANAFVTKLTENAKGGLLYRLPREGEWEYACRGGRPSSILFGIGDGAFLSSREANFNGDYPYGGAEKGPNLEKTTPVGCYKANALGLYDMQGNVWQWCADWYGDYPTGRVVDPTGPAVGYYSRVYRGGSWCSNGNNCRAECRSLDRADSQYSYLGFRVARVLPSGQDK